MISVPGRDRRRAKNALEHAFSQLETNVALAREIHDAQAVVALALANPALDPSDVDAAKERERRLMHVGTDHAALKSYAGDFGLAGTRTYTSSSGVRFYRIVTESFPKHFNYVYVIEIDDKLVLWDCGSGLFDARRMILDGMRLLEKGFDLKVEPADIDVLLISHGHYDHFGDAAWWRENAQAPLWIHELDARVLERFEERTVITGRDMATFLASAGCGDDDVRALVQLYLASKDVYSSVTVDRRLRHGQDLFDGRARVIHTPGHCPGHICLRIDDVVLVADQVLAPITPHLSPQALHPQNGLERYLYGLGRLAKEEGVRLVLPAHYDAIVDLGGRVREIAEDHVEKLRQTELVCQNGATVVDVAHALFGAQEGYNVLLAMLEAGTHVEYLHQLGALALTNLEAVVDNPRVPFRYRATGAASEVSSPFGVQLGGG